MLNQINDTEVKTTDHRVRGLGFLEPVFSSVK